MVLRSVRRRTFLAIFLVALVPAAAALAAGTLLLREAGATAGTLGPWEAVAESGEALVEAATRVAPDDPDVARAAEAHRETLSESLRHSQLWAYLAERFLRILPLLALASGTLLGVVAFGAAGLLSRSLSRPLHELVDWTARIGRSEPLPPPVPGGSGEVVELRALRDALRSMAGELAEGRRRELEAARLRAWAEMARRIAHDLKNPLTPMQLAAATLARSDDPRASAAAEVLLEEIGRLDEMARSFAQLGRLSEAPPSDVDLVELLGRLAERHSTEAVPVRVRTEGHVPLVRGRLDLLDRVFRNLLVNAVEASEPAGGGEVEVVLTGDNGVVRVTVRDRGPGFPEDRLDQLWLPDFTTKRRGTGLGLAIARQGIESHSGRISARNAPGGGAELEVLLPGTAHGARAEGG